MDKRYAGISFRCSRRVYCFEVGALHLKVNDKVVVETDRGVNMGQVVVAPENAELPDGVPVASVKKVLRKAREDDFAKLKENAQRELEVAEICREKIKFFRLKMKLVRAELMHDGSRIVFYFTAENRVDFRELVKELAHTLHIRVEMRQIGIRDAAGMLGGVGICGRELCCSAFLSTFAPVTVKMAKEQNLALNPMKISGICGRLMCCLGYEYDNYSRAGGARRGGNGRRRSGKNSDSGSAGKQTQENKKLVDAEDGAGEKDNSSRKATSRPLPRAEKAEGQSRENFPAETLTAAKDSGSRDSAAPGNVSEASGRQDSGQPDSARQDGGQKDGGPKNSGAQGGGPKTSGSGKNRAKNSGRRGPRSGKGPRNDKNRDKRKKQTS